MARSTEDRVFAEKHVERGDGKIRVQYITCNECSNEYDVTVTHRRKPEQALANMASRAGWQLNLKKQTVVCPDCQEKTKVSKSATVSPPRQPTPADRRNIFKAIEEAYDTSNSCYCEPVTDQSIAKQLGVPWAWVADQREMNFGPAGPDPKIKKLMDRADWLKEHVEKAEKVFYQIGDQLDGFKSELERIEAEIKKL